MSVFVANLCRISSVGISPLQDISDLGDFANDSIDVEYEDIQKHICKLEKNLNIFNVPLVRRR